jgi:hypothetical protein
MSNGKNQNDILRGQPAILGHVAKLAARKDQFPTSVLSFATEQGMVGEQLGGSSNTFPKTRKAACDWLAKFDVMRGNPRLHETTYSVAIGIPLSDPKRAAVTDRC